MDKQPVNFYHLWLRVECTLFCNWQSRIGDRLVWVVRFNDLTHWATWAPYNTWRFSTLILFHHMTWPPYGMPLDVSIFPKKIIERKKKKKSNKTSNLIKFYDNIYKVFSFNNKYIFDISWPSYHKQLANILYDRHIISS